MNRELITAAYRLFLEREPENERVIDHFLKQTRSVEELRTVFLGSPEFEPALRRFLDQNGIIQRDQISQYDVYTGCTPADLAIIRDGFNRQVLPRKGFISDQLGVVTRTASLWDGVQHLDGTVIPPPIPTDYHADAIEWAGLLKSVRSAGDEYAVMELGAGWGPWCVGGAVAARNAGIKNINILAVEGDPGHYEFLKQHLRDNGFNPLEHTLLQAAVGVNAGKARWPKVQSRNDWGSRPIRDNEKDSPGSDGKVRDYLGREFASTIEVEVVPLAQLLSRRPRWNLVHIDIQGEEAAVCQSSMNLLTERVQWIIVGTHSRWIEGELLRQFSAGGWKLENEKPVRFNFQPGAPCLESLTDHDGTQVWRNPKLH